MAIPGYRHALAFGLAVALASLLNLPSLSSVSFLSSILPLLCSIFSPSSLVISMYRSTINHVL